MDRYEPFIAKPHHIYTMCLPLLLSGAVGIGVGGTYFWIGLLLVFLGVGIGAWVWLAGIWQAHAEYIERKAYHLRSLRENMQLMAKIKDPNVWAAMGYELPSPEPTKVEHTPEDPKMLPRLSFPTPPATPPQMQLLANDVLRGGKMTEGRWGGKEKTFSTKEWRSLMKWGEHPDRKYWVFLNPAYPNQGRTRTRRGTEFLLSYADVELQKLFAQKGIDGVEKIGRGESSPSLSS